MINSEELLDIDAIIFLDLKEFGAALIFDVDRDNGFYGMTEAQCHEIAARILSEAVRRFSEAWGVEYEKGEI